MITQEGTHLVRLVGILRRLLADDGCPWDRAQTLESLRPYVVEEAHEVVDAIDRGDRAALRDELGDLLFQIVFQAALAEREGAFGLDDVVDAIAEKMIRRHPWVFGGERVAGEADASSRWEALKAEERRGGKGGAGGALAGVPVAMPALLRASRIGEKAGAVGYDFADVAEVRGKIDEELAELDAAGDDREAAERELGDLLFAIASYGRKRGIDPEAALRGTLARFAARFEHAERSAAARGERLEDLDAAVLDVLWRAAKDDVG